MILWPIFAALLALGTGCSATWEGMQRDTGELFGGEADQVAEAQRLLNERGYDAGPVDGLIGHRTTRAILAYQDDHGLDQTGYVDESVLASLRGSETVQRARTTPPPKEDDWVDPY